ncbi:MAG TPA: ABC-F family ATP-binding cassette domain-containing protein [Myxococcota bacterium]|nr:ABC-F family ATP-binding cassette domain-containing protein [Myxococcota bacterium]
MLLRLDGIAKHFGDRALFTGVSVDVRAGDRIGLVGPNGAGKTTLLRIAAGLEPADAGSVLVPRTSRVALLRQEIDPTRETPVREEVASVLARLDALEREMRELEAQMASHGGEVASDLAARYDRTRHAFEQGGGFEREARVERVLAGLGFEPEDRGRPLRSFSGGWLMRVELAKLLLSEPDVLLLDEPTNHLDLPSIQWFEETLEGFRGGVVVISHDRTFLRRHATRILELEAGRATLYEAGYDRYLEQRAERRAQLEARKEAQDREIAHTERFIERFRYKASKARQVQSRIKALDRIERIELVPAGRKKVRLRIPPPERAGDVPLALENVHKAYGDTVVYRGAELRVRRGDRVALVGPNGAGKSTLLRMLAGVLPPDRGARIVGHNVRVGFFAQHQLEALDPERSVLEELAAGARTDDAPRLRGHLGAFLFSGDDVEKKVSVLSGGEKARLALAKMLLRPVNVLVLDEPTNHLDVDACEVLEQALREYQGTVVLISHDRAFLNAVATRVVEVRAGVLREFPGNYDAYLRSLAGAAASAGPGAVAGHGAPHALEDGRPARTSPSAEPRAKHELPPTPRLSRDEERERRKARDRTAKKIAALEADILARENALEELGWRLGDPAVYKDGAQVRALEVERGEAKRAVEALYREWERLAAELEALEQALGAGAIAGPPAH